MNRLFITFASVLVIVSAVIIVTPETNAGDSFDQIEKRFDRIDEQLDHVMLGLQSGAKRWVSPYWEYSLIEYTGTEQETITRINILNGDHLQTVKGQIIYYSSLGEYRTSQFDVLPKTVRQIAYREPSDVKGWVEIVADGEVFVEGFIQRYIDAEEVTWVSTIASRTMTWYRVGSE